MKDKTPTGEEPLPVSCTLWCYTNGKRTHEREVMLLYDPPNRIKGKYGGRSWMFDATSGICLRGNSKRIKYKLDPLSVIPVAVRRRKGGKP